MNNPFGMPVLQGNPAYTSPPHRFINREYFIITYETDRDALEAILPPGLDAPEPVVKFEFMKMPDASGFGDFNEAGQAIPVTCKGVTGTYIHSMYLDAHAPTAGGREIWGFPKTMGKPALSIDSDHLLGTLDYGKSRVATGTMEYKTTPLDLHTIRHYLQEPGYLVKSIPGVEGKPAICQLVRYTMADINVKWAFSGNATLELHPHVMARLHELPVRRIRSACHFIADLTLPFGEVVIDYLRDW